MPQRIVLRKGLIADIPVLAEGEPGFATDSLELWIGTSAGNELVASFGGSSSRYVVYNTRALPASITAAGGGVSTNVARQLRFVKSNGGAVTVTANPQIAAGSNVGDEMLLIGTSNSDYLIFDTGTGLELNGPKQLKNGSKLHLIWDGSVWSEVPL